MITASVWIGELHDGRQVLTSEERPADAPQVNGTYWKAGWRCYIENGRRVCNFKGRGSCRCAEVLS